MTHAKLISLRNFVICVWGTNRLYIYNLSILPPLEEVLVRRPARHHHCCKISCKGLRLWAIDTHMMKEGRSLHGLCRRPFTIFQSPPLDSFGTLRTTYHLAAPAPRLSLEGQRGGGSNKHIIQWTRGRTLAWTETLWVDFIQSLLHLFDCEIHRANCIISTLRYCWAIKDDPFHCWCCCCHRCKKLN